MKITKIVVIGAILAMVPGCFYNRIDKQEEEELIEDVEHVAEHAVKGEYIEAVGDTLDTAYDTVTALRDNSGNVIGKITVNEAS